MMAEEDELKQIDESKINYKAICCENIPELFLDKYVAKTHFNKFGKVNRFILRPNRLSCTVEFETEAQAAHALMEGDEFNGHKFNINYALQDVAHVQNTEEWVGDAEVLAELDAMSGGSGSSSQLALKAASAQMKASGAPQSSLSTHFKKPDIKTIAKSKPVVRATVVSNIPRLSNKVQRNELEAILRTAARTDDDKLNVLEARDKLIRINMVKITNIKMAKNIQGFCPDMCPEKERYLRSNKGLVTNFEKSEDGYSISHINAVKEYSRSSATKETPLPHELRPESVLKMTMLYLTHSIMDLCDDPEISIQDWFHFCWDRTRAIRSDLTQQEICSLGAVELFEQCARFHIHCAGRLVEEEPAVFDKKINGDNLVKSLQTLKYLYHDLRVKNIKCPCEAEFRSYVVLMNLGNANYLADIKDLPEYIQETKEMRRALRYYNALQTNNYARFFSMLDHRDTTYLEGCILLGYVVKLRENALETMVKAYASKLAQTMPLDYLTRILGFENNAEALDFLEFYGLQCEDNERVFLSRLQPSEFRYTMKRAVIVESKRTVSVGECIFGRSLPPLDEFEKHKPHSSFDEKGMLKPAAWNAEDQLRGEAALLKAKERSLEQQQKQQREDELKMSRQRQQQKQIENQNKPPMFPSNTSGSVKSDNIFKVPQLSQPKPQLQEDSLAAQQSTAAGQQTSPAFPFGSANAFSQHRLQTDPRLSKLNRPDSPFAVNTGGVPSPLKTSTLGTGGSIFGGQATVHKTSELKPTESTSNIFSNPSKQPSNASNSNVFGAVQAHAGTPLQSIFGTKSNNFSGNIFENVINGTPPPTNIFVAPQTKDDKAAAASSSIFNSIGGATSIPQPLNRHQTTSTSIFGGFSMPAAVTTNTTNTTLAAPTAPTDLVSKLFKKIAREEEARQLHALRQEEKRLDGLEILRKKEEERNLAIAEAANAARAAEERRARHKAQCEALEKEAAMATENILDDYVKEVTRTIASNELRVYRNLEERSQTLCEKLVFDSVNNIVQEIVLDELVTVEQEQQLVKRYFEIWFKKVKKAKERRQLMQHIPLFVPTKSLQQCVDGMRHSQLEANLRLIKRYRHGEACDFQKLLYEYSEISTSPINLHRIIAKAVDQKPIRHGCILQRQRYAKFVLTLPGEFEELEGFESLCNAFLSKSLHPTETDDGRPHVPYICALEDNVALCVRKVSGIVAVNEAGEQVRNECDNADAIVFVMTSHSIVNSVRRLSRLLNLPDIGHKPIPVAIVLYEKDSEEENIISRLKLERLPESGQMRNIKFFSCRKQKSEQEFRRSLKQAMRYLAETCEYDCGDDAMEMQIFESWLESTLGEEMWQRWFISSRSNLAFAKVCTAFEHIVGLYNEAVRRLQAMISINLAEQCDFPMELREFVPQHDNSDIPLGLPYFPEDWKNRKNQQELLSFLRKLELPNVNTCPPRTLDEMQLWLLDYAGLCIPHNSMKSVQASHGAIKALIEQLNRPDLSDLEPNSRFAFVNCLHVVKCLVFFHVNDVIENQCHARPKHVFYKRLDLTAYHDIPWWLNFKAVQAVKVDCQASDAIIPMNNNNNISINDECALDFDEEVEMILRRGQAAIEKNEMLLKMQKTEHKQNMEELNCSRARKLEEDLDRFERELNQNLCIAEEAILNDIDSDLDNVFPVNISASEIEEYLNYKPPSKPSNFGKSPKLSLMHRSPIHCESPDGELYARKRKILEHDYEMRELLEHRDEIMDNANDYVERLGKENALFAEIRNSNRVSSDS